MRSTFPKFTQSTETYSEKNEKEDNCFIVFFVWNRFLLLCLFHILLLHILPSPVVDWTDGTLGKIPVGPAARMGESLAARDTCTLQ